MLGGGGAKGATGAAKGAAAAAKGGLEAPGSIPTEPAAFGSPVPELEVRGPAPLPQVLLYAEKQGSMALEAVSAVRPDSDPEQASPVPA